MNVALIQMVSSQKLEVNLREAETLIAEAASGADYIFLPENFAVLASENPRRIGNLEMTREGPIRAFFAISLDGIAAGFLEALSLLPVGQMVA